MKIVTLAALQPPDRALLEAQAEVAYAGWAVAAPVVTPLPEDDEIIRLARDAQALIVPGEVSARVMDACPQLKVIGVARGEFRGVDLAAATARGIRVVYAAGRNAAAVAELTLAFILLLHRQILPAHQFVAERRWRTWDDLFATSLVHGLELGGRVLGLVGFGLVGREVARRARAFDMHLLAYDPYLPAEVVAGAGAEATGLPELLARSDVVSVHCKVTDETRGLLGPAEFARMKPGTFFINTARAAVVDQAALLQALRSGHLGGAALDVYWDEPLPVDSPLLGVPNLLHTPHIGGATLSVEARTSTLITQDVLRVLRGEAPEHLANPEVMQGPSPSHPSV